MHLLRLLPLAAAAALLAPPAADAAVTLGAHAPAGSTVNNNVIDTTTFQVSTPAGDPSYTVPAGGGVITRWAMQEGPGPFDAAKDRAALRVFRANGDGSFTVVAAAADEAMRAPFANLPLRIPVLAGDLLGIRLNTSATKGAAGNFARPGGVLAQVGGDPKAGDKVTPLGQVQGWRVNVSAVVEPDADGDGFGDETQDACPTSAATQGACPAPPALPAPPAPPVLPAPDTVAPKLTLPKLAARQKARRGYVELRIGSTEAATVTATARRGRKTLGTLTTKVAAGRTKVVKVKLGKKVGRGTVKVTLVARDAVGNVATVNRTITLTR